MPKSISAPSKQWRRWLAMHWFVYIVCFAVLAGSVITFLFPGILPPTSVIKLPGQLDEMIQQKAISAVISAVGATAVVIAWLIGVTNQTVCGERIGVLINWAYPGFFLYYFTIFLTTVLFGAYVGNAGNRRLPVVLAATGILIGVILIGRVCYVFVLPSEERERIAFTYHMYLLKRRNCPRLEKMKNWFIIGRYISSRTSRREDFRLSSHRIMLSVANVTAKKEADGEDIRADDIWELWKTCIDEYKNRESNLVPDDGVPSSSSTKKYHPANLNSVCCFLAERFWGVLFIKSGVPCQHESFLYQLLMKDEWNDNSEKYLDHLLTGLLFRFAREHVNAGRQDNEDISWKIAYQTLTDTLLQLKREGQFSSEVFGKLFWGLALIMVIESAYGKNVDFKLINELADRLNFSVHEYFQQAEKTENPEEPVTNELRRLQAFLTDLRCVFLQEFGYYDGIYSKTKKDYKTVLESYLLQSLSLTDNYNASYFNDLAVICWVLEKGD